ncbi:RNA polymerase sigma factor SigK [Streptomyces cirratus]|uniref:RNA polymerase sigma factor SigK n=2 Tax=Streptomyces cirratus TaxID=68187 RepID=A0ABQ3F0G7_9ACTN|nr:RNA polymerase sigma factor SigK [Streptomyces cirratus]
MLGDDPSTEPTAEDDRHDLYAKRPPRPAKEAGVRQQPVTFGTPREPSGPDLPALMGLIARGDQDAFAELYEVIAGPVHGIVVRVLRDRAQSEEVTQEVLIEVWRQAPRYRPDKGSVMTWVMTIAHRRAVDRVRSAQAATAREQDNAAREHTRAYDEVSERVEIRLESEQVRRCVRGLTELQRQAVHLAYYGGLTYREVAETLSTPLPTVKTRLRDGLIRLRDCMGVTA